MTSADTMWVYTHREEDQKDSRNWFSSKSMNSASKRRSLYGKGMQYTSKEYKQPFGNFITAKANDKLITIVSLPKIIELYRPDTHKTRLLEATETVEDTIHTLKSLGFNEIAERLAYLQKVVEEEEGDGGDPIEFQSLKNFSIFIVRKQGLPMPQIGITMEGLIHTVWDPPGIGTLVMNFLKSGDIAFTALYHQHTPKNRRRRINGELPPDLVIKHVQDFMHTPASK